MTIYHITVQNYETAGISIFAPWGKTSLKPAVNSEDLAMERAIELAIKQGKDHIAAEMAKQSLMDYEILVDRKDSRVKGNGGSEMAIETVLEIAAVGHMKNANAKPKQKSLLGAFWGKDKAPDYSKIPSAR